MPQTLKQIKEINTGTYVFDNERLLKPLKTSTLTMHKVSTILLMIGIFRNAVRRLALILSRI